MAEAPIARFEWRVSPDLIPGCGSPGEGVRLEDGIEENLCLLCCTIPLRPGKVIAIGRERQLGIDKLSICLDNLLVSRKHCIIYSIADDCDNDWPPMVYVRDCGSVGGTFVNNQPIGSVSREAQRGFLLSDKDVITVKPYWQLICHLSNGRTDALSNIQRQEANLFQSRYIIFDRVIGRGASGVVHLAFDRRQKKQIACKILKLDHSSKDPRLAQPILKTYLREADTMAKIRHPGVLAFEHAFRSTHTIFLFTELATSGDLFSKMVGSPKLSGDEMKFVMHQVIRTVEYIHSKLGLAHRDLKPENIFFASGPESETRVILGDFGHAKARSWGRMKSCVGTDRYQAPELYSNCDQKGHNKLVDMWAIGIIVLYAILPDHGRDFENVELALMSQEQLDEHLSSAFRRSVAQDVIDPQMWDFVVKCLRIDPASRMTASQAKAHSWVQVGDEVSTLWKHVRNSFWKPKHGIQPLMEELPDVRDKWRSRSPAFSGAQQTVPLRQKRAADDLQQVDTSSTSAHFPAKKVKEGQV